MQGACKDNFCRLGIKPQRCDVLEAFLCGFRSLPVNHTSLVNLFQDILHHYVDRDIHDYLSKIFAMGSERTAGIRPATSNIVYRHSPTLCKDVSSIFTHLNGRLLALDSKPSTTVSSNP